MLLGQLFTSPKIVAMTLLNGLVLNLTAIFIKQQPMFVLFLVAELFLAIVLTLVVRRTAEARERGLPTPKDLYVITTMLWCMLQRAVAFTLMRTGDQTLQVLSAASTMATLGPVAARNNAAPRLVMLFVCFCGVPMTVGAVISGNPGMWVLALQTPLFFYAMNAIARHRQPASPVPGRA